MKSLRNYFLLTITLMIVGSGVSFASANSLPSEFLAKASPKVKEIVVKNKLDVVEYDYVLKAIGDGTRKNASSVLIDARPLKKYQIAHIPSSLALPDSKFDKLYEGLLGKVAKSKELIIYCGGYACAKSPKVALMLMKKGFKNVKVYAAGMPEWTKKNYVEIDSIVAKALFDKKSEALFIDARPYGKFAGSTIVGSIGVPDTKFEAYAKFMPKDKKAMVVTFCGGYACHKSHSIAEKLVKMGYTNVKVYAAGFPEWKKSKFPITGGGAKATAKKTSAPKVSMSKSGVLQKGADSGTVDGEWFKANLSKLPKSVTLVDVRDPKDFASGSLPGAINIHAEKMTPEQLAKAIPQKGDVVFFCGTGTRAMEARGFLEEDLEYPQIDRIWYFDANIACDKKGNCKIEPNEPIGI